MPTGRIKLHHKQFAFIENSDIYIDKFSLADAFDKDLVEYKVVKTADNRTTGKVTKVLKRYREQFVVEIFKKTNNLSYGLFQNHKIIQNVVIADHPNSFLGEKVLIQIENFDRAKLRGRLVKSLGHKDEIGVDIASIINDLNIPVEFSELANQESAKLTYQIEEFKQSNKFVSLVDKAFFTIDPTDSKDFDDAICVEKIEGNRFLVSIAIADVWSYLKTCPNIENDALERGSSVYLLNSVIPMLPCKLSNNYCSLVENEERNTLVVTIEATEEGETLWETTKIFPAIIKSKKRFTYDQVNDYFAKNTNLSDVNPDVVDTLNIAFDAYKVIDKKRDETGYLKINKDTHKFKLNELNEIQEIYIYRTGEAQKLIETFMVLANVCVANFCQEKQLPSIYRNHENPKLEKIENFTKDSKELGFFVSKVSFHNFGVKVINKWIADNQNIKHINMVKLLILQSLEKATYSTKKTNHFGLNLKNYLHFTSPIRRLPDLVVHKLLWMNIFDKESYSKEQVAKLNNELDEISSKSTEAEILHSSAEYAVIKEKVFKFLTKGGKDVFVGVVVARHKHGLTAKIDDIYDVFVRTDMKLTLSSNISISYCKQFSEFKLLRVL